MRRSLTLPVLALSLGSLLGSGSSGALAASVMQQCGQEYQAAKAANTLGGKTWNQFRSECSARLKAEPASAPVAPAPAPAPVTQTANPLKPVPAPPAVATTTPAPAAPTTTAATPAATTPAGAPAAATGGRAAFYVREKECGSEWRTNKVTLVAQTPGLTWPKYLSQCNTRLKAAGK